MGALEEGHALVHVFFVGKVHEWGPKEWAFSLCCGPSLFVPHRTTL